MPDREHANASQIADSDSDEEVKVPPVINFDKQMGLMPKDDAYNPFDEVDAAADEEARLAAAEEYGGSNKSIELANPATHKSALKGSMSKPSDGFARVTWTDLAKGAYGSKVERGSLRSGSGRRATMQVS